jgi:hypothetical protein
MKTMTEIFQIEKVKFNNFSDEYSLIGTYSQDNLSYDTELRLHQSSLNQLMNQLQKLNAHIEIGEMIATESLPNGETHFLIDLTELNNVIPFYSIVSNREYKQIRA